MTCVLSCSKDETDFKPEPRIELVEVIPATAIEFTDAVTLVISYRDGDGDLGENATGVKNCFVTDHRIGITHEFRIRQLAPSDKTVPIKGKLNIDLGVQALTGNGNEEVIPFTVKVVDRAGRESNSVSANVTLRRN